MKILNLYAGIGGNRKLWGSEHKVTAVEYKKEIANIYQDYFPDDDVIIGDAHEYLLNNFQKYDFIWASPPCPTHSRFNHLNFLDGDYKYPDMTLYQEIILLQNWFKGSYCVENVISYYEPLIKPFERGSHYFWTNFYIPEIKNEKRGIRGEEIEYRQERINYNLDKYKLEKSFKKKIMNNCTEPELGLKILNSAIKQLRLKEAKSTSDNSDYATTANSSTQTCFAGFT